MKKTTKKTFKVLLLTVITLFIFCSCGSTAENKILGRWDSDIYSYVFYEDGNYDRYTNKNGELEYYYTSGHGTWTITETQLRINDYAVGPTVFNFKFDNGNLLLDNKLYTKGTQ